jgi:hypothetical protein
MTIDNYSPGPVNAEGCVFGDFLLTEHLPAAKAPAVIERDRLIMSARPGFNRKLLPLRVENDSGKVYSGGRYLFDTYENALAFADWCKHDFEIDCVLFPQRPDFDNFTSRSFRVIGAHDFKDIHTSQIVCRTEIWKTNKKSIEDKLAEFWPAADNKSSLWLLCNEETREFSLVTITDRLRDVSCKALDYASLNAAESAGSCADEWKWAEKIFDRSHWVYTIWFPHSSNANAKPPLWPNSPPLPQIQDEKCQ